MSTKNTSPSGLAQKGSFAQRGVVLLEALVAILIFSMGVLAVVGLQAAMIKNTANSKARGEASYIAQQRLGMMWSDTDNLNNYLALAPGEDISNLLPNGKLIVEQQVAGQFQVTVTWQQPGESEHNFTTTASISGN